MVYYLVIVGYKLEIIKIVDYVTLKICYANFFNLTLKLSNDYETKIVK